MTKIKYDERIYNCGDETLLNALLRQGKEIPFSCKNGVCHVCLMQATNGAPPKESQAGLPERLQAKNYFLPCKCLPTSNLTIAKPRNVDLVSTALVHKKTMLSDNVCQILLEPSIEVYFHAGQFINIRKDEKLVRSYSIASTPKRDYFVEVHVKRHSQGEMSRWLVDELKEGEEIEFTSPGGGNYYRSEAAEPLILIATGTGLAPVLGIAKDALNSGHTAPIHLYHGATNQQGLYQHAELLAFEKDHASFHYHPCVSADTSIEQALEKNHKNLCDYIIHMAGNPGAIDLLEKVVLGMGAGANNVLLDPFVIKPFIAEGEASESEQNNNQPDERPYPAPSFDIWQALGEGRVLRPLLDEFYDEVFNDPILSPYFHNSTKGRAKEKVYSFYRRLFSGERVYFGDRPRNAHHWMVITDEVFDYREALLKRVMVKHGLSDEVIKKWLILENYYRPDIVKPQPRGRVIDGVETASEGYGALTLTAGSMCDTCHREIEAGTTITYHLRTGETYCPQCLGNKAVHQH